MMGTCVDCGADFASSSGKKERLCPACRRRRLENTWKRQMRMYGAMALCGLILVVIDYFQFKALHAPLVDASPLLLVMLILGGLGLMGGMFGFALALFFSLWHKKK